MFGASNAFGGGFGSNNQQPQQPQSGGLFGAAQPAPSGFNVFGQQQQPAAATPFGQQQSTGFGTNTFGASASTTPFGTTPATTNAFAPQQNTSGLFGAPAQHQATPSAGFGGFGTAAPNNAFGSFGTNAASNNPTGTSLFGAKPPATNTFGAATAGFGNNAFGQTAPSLFGASNIASVPNGTANPIYAPHTIIENESTPSQKSTFNSIVAMDAYKNWSFEELRFQDYTQGRKTATPTNNTFGVQQPQQQTGFGAFNANANATQAGGFNQPQQQTGIFGNPAPVGNAFGIQPPASNLFGQQATGATNAFGQTQNNANPSPFGAPAAQPTSAFGNTSLFNSNPTSNAFGAQPAKPSIFGNPTNAFGAANTPPANNSLFGQTNPQPQGSLFGAQPSQTQPSTGLFAQNNTSNTGTSGLFGNNNQNNAPKPGGLFGSTGQNNSLFGQAQPNQTAATSPFGFPQNNQQNTQSGGGGMFGNNNLPAQNTGSLFGNNNNPQQQQPAASGGLFGNSTTTASNPFGTASGGLFGNNNSSAASGGLFGQKQPNTSISLFGNKDGSTQQNTNSFGNTTSGNLFGSSTPSSGLFGNNNNNNNNGLFGLNNNSQNNQQGLQNSLFQSHQSNQQMLQAHIDQGAYGNNPIFANHGVSGGSKPAIPIKKQLPTIDFKPIPRPNTKITKLRGFARSASPAKSVNGGSPMNVTLGASSLSNTIISRSSAYGRPAEEPLLSPKAFIVRPSPKKLTIDPSTLSSMLRDRSATLNGSPVPVNGTPPPKAPAKNMAVLNPDAEVSALQTFSKNRTPQSVTENASKAANTGLAKSPTHTIGSQPASPHVTQAEKATHAHGSSALGDAVVVTTREKAKTGEYWTVPAINDLQQLSRKDLRSVPHFAVGRNGFGQIEFQEDVDLAGIANLEEDLCGEVIVFKQSICSVYPDDLDDKPPVGQGLNVPAVITLENCWALDKATREPIKDPNHPRVKQFSRRLMKSEETKFLEYDAESGKWTFMVEHFTTYGIDDSDEESENSDQSTGDDEASDNEDQYTPSEEPSPRPKPRAVRSKRAVKLPHGKVVCSDEEDGPPQMMLFGDEDESSTSRDAQMFELSGSSGGSQAALKDDDDDSTSSITGSDGEDIQLNPLGKKRPREISSAEESQPSIEPAPRSQNWRAQLGIESKKVAVMQASLFASPASPPKVKAVASSRQSPWTRPPTSGPSRPLLTYASAPPLTIANGHQADFSSTESHPIKSTTRETNPPMQRIHIPNRCVKQVPLSKSILSGHEGSPTDASLALARSFRISWTTKSDQLIHFRNGEVGNMLKIEEASSTGSQLVLRTIPTTTFALPREIELVEHLLEVQLRNTMIQIEDGIPFMITNPKLRFRDFVAVYDKTDRCNDLNVWRLGSALYDELDLRLPKNAAAEVIERIKNLRREDAFSQWLQHAVSSSVEHDLRTSVNGDAERPFGGIFKLLTGNQIERACNASIQAGNYRLATLVAQCARSNSSFKSNLLQQNIAWHELRADAYIDRDLRKIYELMSGNATLSKGFGNKALHADYSEDIRIAEDLDWKRNLGIHFWFQASSDNFWNALKTYEDAIGKEGLAMAPVPWYLEKQDRQLAEIVVNEWAHEPAYDAMFHLIKMSVESTYALEKVLEPKGFGPCPFDYRMPWHLYQMLSRVMRVRDFEDREIVMGEMDDDDEAVEGNSPSADLLTTHYASQLSRLGHHKWAFFVLLHLEVPERRKAAVQSFLSKNIELLDSQTETFLTKSLKIPSSWVYTAHAELAQYERRFLDQYRWLMKAQLFTDAHRVVVKELAPETVIRGDLSGLKDLFSGLCSDNVVDWPSGGKIFLDYVNIVEQLPILLRDARGRTIESNYEVKFLLESVLPNLLREIPLLYARRGASRDKHKVCMSEMLSNLVNTSTSVALVVHKYDYTNDFINLAALQGSDKLLWTQRCAVNGFSKALKRAGAEEVN